MAFTKEEKKELVSQYETWLKDSKAIYVMSYSNMSMSNIDQVREKAEEVGGEIHVVKNTLMDIALKNVDFSDEGFFDGSSIVGFALQDAPSVAKILNTSIKDEGFFAFKGGYLNGEVINIDQIVTLAELPSRDEVRAQLLSLINTPATKLLRTIAEPARGVAMVLKSFSEKEAAPAAS